ncbi:MAG: TM0106 family RecB-like putative nuclease, partial [Steroidobacteraceae bacterium]
IRRDQIRKLERANVRTLRDLATLPAERRPADLRQQTFDKLRAQAAMQLRGREAGKPLAEGITWPDNELRGLKRLPAPDTGDVYFDMEGDPHVEGGLEYLFGVVTRERGKLRFEKWWAHTREQERVKFEEFMDWLTARLEKHPAAHVYHYASYEPTALKRLASLHATREEFLDTLLRGKKLVDVFATTREAFRVSTASYGLKHVEALYGRTRAGAVQTAGQSVVEYEKYLETHDAALLEKIADYNRDDCESLAQLHQWLLAQRPRELPWFNDADPADEPPKPALSAARIAEDAETERVRLRLLAGEPDPTRELVSYLLDFHRRADKPQYWEMFDRQKKEYEELIDDTEAIAGLKLVGQAPGKKLPRYVYEYPEQDFKLRAGDQCCRLDNLEAVTIESIDEDNRRIVLYGGRLGPNPPMELNIGAGRPHESKVLREAVRRYGAASADGADR